MERERSYSTKRGIVAKIRSRSASISRRSRSKSTTRRSSHHLDYDDDVPLPTLDNSSDRAPSMQVEDIIERHQLALKMDMIDLMDNHEKEVRFWKNKALKLKKKMSREESIGQTSQNVSNREDDRLKSDNSLRDRVSILERVVKNRDTVIDSLRQTMETQEMASNERIRLLENELERLVETDAATAVSSNPAQLTRKVNTGGNEQDPAYEISILEQLLARVLAEKDKLLFENQNLISVLSERKTNSTSNGSQGCFKLKKDCKPKSLATNRTGGDAKSNKKCKSNSPTHETGCPTKLTNGVNTNPNAKQRSRSNTKQRSGSRSQKEQLQNNRKDWRSLSRSRSILRDAHSFMESIEKGTDTNNIVDRRLRAGLEADESSEGSTTVAVSNAHKGKVFSLLNTKSKDERTLRNS